MLFHQLNGYICECGRDGRKPPRGTPSRKLYYPCCFRDSSEIRPRGGLMMPVRSRGRPDLQQPLLHAMKELGFASPGRLAAAPNMDANAILAGTRKGNSGRVRLRAEELGELKPGRRRCRERLVARDLPALRVPGRLPGPLFYPDPRVMIVSAAPEMNTALAPRCRDATVVPGTLDR